MPHADVAAPSAWVQRWLATLPAHATVLDVACGSGRHVRLAFERGLVVTAVDRDVRALEGLPDGVERVHADLEGAPWPLGDRRFDAVVVTNYLHRPLFPALLAALAADGVLIYETFARGQAHYGRPTRDDFLLAPAELLAHCRPALHVVAFEDGVRGGPPPARVQRIVGIRIDPDEDRARARLERARL